MRVLITAGPTREPLDPVRFLSNRSSGRMGYALAAAAVELGHQVTLISGPVNLEPPSAVTLLRVETAQQMHDAVAREISTKDAAIFAAAVADYRPVAPAAQKLKKTSPHLSLQLERTPDILAAARTAFGFRGYLVGFAAETENVTANAGDKLKRKGCDLIIANDVSREGIGFDSAENEVTLCLPDGQTLPLPRQPKTALARALMVFITQRATASSCTSL
jgi:phosphopantothenoylcysteine synthetase/decarboxylase